MWRYDWGWLLLCAAFLTYQLRSFTRLVMEPDDVVAAGRTRMRIARAVPVAGIALAAANAVVRFGVRVDWQRDVLANELAWVAIQVGVVASAGIAAGVYGRPRGLIDPALRDI